MIGKENYLLILLVYFLIGCEQNKSETCTPLTKSSIYKESSAFFSQNQSSDTNSLIDSKINNYIGGEYTFYADGNLKQYMFFTDSIHYTYAEFYTQDGNLIKTEGIPLLSINVDEINQDSIGVNFYFFCLNKHLDTIKAVVNNLDTLKVTPAVNETFSNTKRHIALYNAKGIEKLTIKCNATYSDCRHNKITVADSITISRIKVS